MAAEDLQDLRLAYRALEHPGLAARLTSIVGTPLEVGFKLLPKAWYRTMHSGFEKGVGRALTVAVASLRDDYEPNSHDPFYKGLAFGCGAVGGLFGLPGLLVELPVTTTVILRSIADIARTYEEDLRTAEARVACLEVFALGARTEEDDAADTGYYGIRLALALPVTQALPALANLGVGVGSHSMLTGLVRTIASRFGVAVSHKAAAQMVPLIGAGAGALVNTVFMDHFQRIARGHFTIRRLERQYGKEVVEVQYRRLGEAEMRRRRGRRRAAVS